MFHTASTSGLAIIVRPAGVSRYGERNPAAFCAKPRFWSTRNARSNVELDTLGRDLAKFLRPGGSVERIAQREEDPLLVPRQHTAGGRIARGFDDAASALLRNERQLHRLEFGPVLLLVASQRQEIVSLGELEHRIDGPAQGAGSSLRTPALIAVMNEERRPAPS